MLKELEKEKRNVNINVKLTKEERELIQKQADKYAGGSVSAWIRYATINFEPKE